MKVLWPFVSIILVSAGLIAGACCIWVMGTIVGSVLESIVLSIPSLLYNLPHLVWDSGVWLIGVLWKAIINPVRTICLVLGILLVLTAMRGIYGGFQQDPAIYRGSKVRNADDIFPDFGISEENAESLSTSWGQRINGYVSSFSVSLHTVWGRLCQVVRKICTRSSDGEDLR